MSTLSPGTPICCRPVQVLCCCHSLCDWVHTCILPAVFTGPCLLDILVPYGSYNLSDSSSTGFSGAMRRQRLFFFLQLFYCSIHSASEQKHWVQSSSTSVSGSRRAIVLKSNVIFSILNVDIFHRECQTRWKEIRNARKWRQWDVSAWGKGKALVYRGNSQDSVVTGHCITPPLVTKDTQI